ncbi:MAG: hypothetical protein ABJG78_00420 [Cyclobacteriaceae bacterium]
MVDIRDSTYKKINSLSNRLQWYLKKEEYKNVRIGMVIDFIHIEFGYSAKSLRALLRKLDDQEELYLIPQVHKRPTKSGRRNWYFGYTKKH